MPDNMPSTLHGLLRQLDEQGITDHRRYEQVRRYLGFKAREKNLPISGLFELTPLCNLDCKMCYVHMQKEQLSGAQLLTVEQWKAIMHQAVTAGMMYARLSGGECLSYPGFKELYLFLQQHGMEVTVLTNGLMMTEDIRSFFRLHPPAMVQVTLYGASDDAYEQVTGRRAFHAVIDNIRRAREAGIPLHVAVTPNAFMHDGEAVVQLLHSEGFSFTVNAGLMEPRKETGRVLPDSSLDQYVAIMKLRRELAGRPVAPDSDPDSLADPGGRHTTTEKGVRCGAGRSSFAVDWRGGMRPCNTFPCDAVSVLEMSFDEAWKRTNSVALDYPLPVECAGCSYESICKHCVAEHAANAAPGHASPEICKWGRRMIAEGLLKLQLP